MEKIKPEKGKAEDDLGIAQTKLEAADIGLKKSQEDFKVEQKVPKGKFVKAKEGMKLSKRT